MTMMPTAESESKPKARNEAMMRTDSMWCFMCSVVLLVLWLERLKESLYLKQCIRGVVVSLHAKRVAKPSVFGRVAL